MQESEDDNNGSSSLGFTDCVFNMATGDIIFASVAPLDNESYVMSIPLIMKKYEESADEHTISSKIAFVEYCPFTDDRFTLVRTKDIVSMNTLSDQAKQAYLRAVRSIYDSGSIEDIPMGSTPSGVDEVSDFSVCNDLYDMDVDDDTVH